MSKLVSRREPASLRTIVAVTLAALIMGLAAVRGAITGYQSQTLLEDQIGRSLAEMAFSMADTLDTDMAMRAAQVSVLSTLDAARDPATAQRMVNELKERDPTLAWVGLTDATGTVLAASDGVLLGADISSRPVYRRGREGLFLGDVHDAVLLAKLLPNPTGEPMKFVDVAAPMRDAQGRTVGVLALHFSWNWAREVVASLLAPARGREGLEVFVVAADGVVLLGPAEAVGKTLALPSVGHARSGRNGWAVETWPDGGRYLTGYTLADGQRDFKGFGWTLLVRQPLDVAYAPATYMLWFTIVTGLVLAVLFSAAGWFAAGRITRPLKDIARAADRLRTGEAGATIPEAGGAREIHSLSRSLRDLIASLTDHKTALARMEDIAYQDRLTTLPNRRFYEQYVDVALARAGADLGRVIFLYIDLDGFKPVNDRLGHDAGDAVLRAVALRLASSLRGDDVVARIGGDEFAAVLPCGCGEDGGVPEITARIIASVNEPIIVNGEAVRVGCSIGVAEWPRDGADRMEVLKRADEALYAAKRAGKNQAVAWETA